MYKITMAELKRNSFMNAFIEGYKLFQYNIFRSDSIQCIKPQDSSDDRCYFACFIEGDKLIKVSIEVLSNGRIYNYYCNCNEVGHYVGGMCKHLTALCFSIIANVQNEEIILDTHEKEMVFKELMKKEEERRLVSLKYKRLQIIEENKHKYNNLMKKYQKNERPIILKDKVSLYPTIYISERCITLSFKIGINRLYVVRNINLLLSQIYNKELVQYGKNLAFYHCLENFDDKSQKIIKTLMVQNRYIANPELLSSNKEMYINNVLLEKILEIYKNDYLHIGFVDHENFDIKYAYISDEKYSFTIRLSEQGELSLDIKNKDLHLLKGYYCDYVCVDETIYLLDEQNSSVKPLLEFLLFNEKLDISVELENFLVELYPRIYNYIEIDDNFKAAHPIQEVRIDSYMSFDNGIIEVETKYFINQEELPLDVIRVSKINLHKLDEYAEVIENLGFTKVQDIYTISSTADIVTFLRADLTCLKDFGDVYLSESLKRTSISRMKKGQINISYDIDMLSVAFENFGYTDDELYKILNGYKSKKKFIKLHKDVIVEIDEEIVKEISGVAEQLGLDEKHLSNTKNVPIYQSLGLSYSQEMMVNIDDKVEEIITNIKNFKNSDFTLDNSIKHNLRNYQIEAFNWLKILANYKFGGVLADEMGLGKTIEMISLFSSDEINKPSLIVCPKSLTYNWKNEIKKWSSNIPCVVIYGQASERKKITSCIDNQNKVIYITSYDSLRNDIEDYQTKKFRFIVLDEGQFIKNTTALKTRAVKQLNGEVRFALTGTPIENSLADLWSIFDFVLPNYLSTYQKFKDKYEVPIINYQNSDALNVLTKKVSPFILRRTKKDVLSDLPEKFETVHYAFMEETQRKAYESYLLRVRDELNSGNSKFQVLSMLTRLRQLCVDPKMFLSNYDGESCKLDLGVELIKNYSDEGHKILVFSQFKSMFPHLISLLESANIKYFILTGDTSGDERMRLVDEFNSNPEIKVFLISLKAGGTGLNLTGADIVIHFDPWWNISAENQATDRAHRIGQTNDVQVIKIICANSIEQKVLELQEIKKELTSKVISDNEDNILKLDQNDFKYLLS